MTFASGRPLRRQVERSLSQLVGAVNRTAADDPAFKKALPEVPSEVQASLFQAVLEAARQGASTRDSLAEDLGSVHEALLEHRIRVSDDGRVSLAPSLVRRRAGAHYTPRELSEQLVERTLSPLCIERDSQALLGLRICDPAMGSGVLLAASARFLAKRVAAARHAERRRGATYEAALADVAVRCLHGVDQDPTARDLCLFALTRLARLGKREAAELAERLTVGDALDGEPRDEGGTRDVVAPETWVRRFPEVFGSPRRGFDACIGNPPWVAFAGRAAQPLDDGTYRHYERTNPAFRGYRTLHGLFVRRSAELLREGGRLGLVLPTSVADLAGYAPTRDAHDVLCEPDEDLLDFGNGSFPGVFQPCMGLSSTRLSGRRAPRGRPWPLASRLDVATSKLLERLSALDPIDPKLFGERGYQTVRSDAPHFSRKRESSFTLPMHEGIDVGELSLAPPSVFANPKKLAGRVRSAEEWSSVAIFIRQTARYPIATVSDGHAFRNSILAGFESKEWTGPALAAYLNSLLVRFYHYGRHRDAREGMPQLKIAHLRAVPHLRDSAARTALHDLSVAALRRGSGIDGETRQRLDEIVFEALSVSDAERQLVSAWAIEHPVPRPRKRKRA